MTEFILPTSMPESDPDALLAIDVSRQILQGEWSAVDALLADDFRYNGDLGDVYDRDQYVGFMQAMRAAMSDMTMELTHVVSSGGLVSSRFITRARNTGKFMGAPATKKQVEVRGVFIRRVVDGRIAEEWQATDLPWLMTQMGFGTRMGHPVASGLLHRKPPTPERTHRPAERAR